MLEEWKSSLALTAALLGCLYLSALAIVTYVVFVYRSGENRTDPAHQSAPEFEAIASIQASLRDLEPLAPTLRGPELMGELQGLLLILEHLAVYPPAQCRRLAKPVVEAANRLKRLSSQLDHAPRAERAAYSLGDED